MNILNKIKNIVARHEMWTKSGFTIIETLVAITILMIAIAGPLSIAGKGLAVAQDAKEQMTALYIAQSQLEYLKNLRDTDLGSSVELATTGADSHSWMDRVNPGQTNATDSGGRCIGPRWCTIDTSIDPVSSTGGVQCVISDCDVLYSHPTKFYYTYRPTVGATPMKLSGYNSRYQINMKSTVGGGQPYDDAEVTILVTWGTNKGLQTFQLKSDLMNALR